MDGNRRYGEKIGKDRKEGHKYGLESLKKLFEKLKENDLGIKTLSFYTFSKENFSRTEEEKKYLFKLLENSLEEIEKHIKQIEEKSKEEEKKVNINVIGDLELFPKELVEKIKKLLEKNVEEPYYNINFLLGYSGQYEIIKAIQKFVEENKKNIEEKTKLLDEKNFRKYLWLGKYEPVNIIIRTGTNDRKRLSGFMLYDSSYAELYFLNKLWPEFTYEDLKSIIEDYKTKRTKNFGK